MMNESDFEGTLVLEKLALIDRVDAFFDAIDADTIAIVFKQIKDA